MHIQGLDLKLVENRKSVWLPKFEVVPMKSELESITNDPNKTLTTPLVKQQKSELKCDTVAS